MDSGTKRRMVRRARAQIRTDELQAGKSFKFYYRARKNH